MEEKLDRLEKNMNDLIEIVVSIKDHMATKQELAEVEERLTAKMATNIELTELEERLSGKIEGVQRSVDGAYERQSALEARVSKVEAELHI
ncbi:MAG: hypothetical protein WCK46_02385 [Candidatus Adlerbacteria bacterium]